MKQLQKTNKELNKNKNNLNYYSFEDLGHTKFDHHRSLRTGFPEVIFGKGKTKEHLLEIIKKVYTTKKPILITKVENRIAEEITLKYNNIQYNQIAKAIILNPENKNNDNNDINYNNNQNKTKKWKKKKDFILIVTAGTSDIPIAEEAAITCKLMNQAVETLFDVGVAGLHRLLAHKEKIEKAKIIIVIAGMEGALASVIAGLASCPVIAVPTSIGYGASFKGLAALLSMLNCCSPGVVVVNIDNGFGAAAAACKIMKVNETKRSKNIK